MPYCFFGLQVNWSLKTISTKLNEEQDLGTIVEPSWNNQKLWSIVSLFNLKTQWATAICLCFFQFSDRSLSPAVLKQSTTVWKWSQAIHGIDCVLFSIVLVVSTNTIVPFNTWMQSPKYFSTGQKKVSFMKTIPFVVDTSFFWTHLGFSAGQEEHTFQKTKHTMEN